VDAPGFTTGEQVKGVCFMAKHKNDHPAEVEARIVAHLDGAASKLSSGETLRVLGATYDAQHLTAELSSRRVPYTTTNGAHEALSEAVKARDAAQPGTIAFLDALDLAVGANFGPTSQSVESFGVTPRKARRKLTADEKRAQAEKARLTRARVKAARAQPPAPPTEGGASTPPKP
jgi:hypothetical protein